MKNFTKTYNATLINWRHALGMILMVVLMIPAIAVSQSPAPVNLGTAGNFVVLAKSGISTTGTTSIVGDIGVSPIDHTAITGFSLILDPSGQFATSSLVEGRVYAADYATPTPTQLTTAVSDMETAYIDAAGRPVDYTELYAGDLTGQTLTTGVYKWSTNVLISGGGVTISGSPTDVWIFQIAGDLTLANTAIVSLSGGAQASNIFWQVAGQTTLGTTSEFSGIILCQTLISLQTGAAFDGRALAQTAVTLDGNSIDDGNDPDIVCPLDITVDNTPDTCGAIVTYADATATDSNGDPLPVTQTAGPASGSLFPLGDTHIEFSANDNGTTVTCSFTITVVDNQAPVAVCQNITIQLDANGVATISAEDLNGGSTDNCGGILTYTANQTSFDCSHVGENTITLTVTDEAGNSSTCTAIVTVEDTIAPVAMCAAPFTIQLDADGNASITVADIDNGSTDNCSVASMTLSQSTFTCADLGENTITLTITDPSGNTTTCTTVVTVEDTIAPIVSCIDFTLELGPDGTALLTPEDIGGTSTDNCAITITAIDIENFDCMDIGTPTMVTYFATDGAGNNVSCTAMVTVVDMLGPVIDCPEDQTVDTDPESITYTLPDYFGDGLVTATDNCTDPVTVFSQTPAPGTLLLDGTYTITLTATDEYGNETVCEFELTVDTILGAEDNPLDFSSLTMYPNPAEYMVTIGNPKFMTIDNINVYDIQGRLVLSKNTAGATGNQTLQVGHLASAVYMVVIESNGKQAVKRLIRK